MRVIVTRPEPEATRTAEKLAEMGFEPVVFPLTRIEPLATPEVDSDAFTAVAVTSVNALRHAQAVLLDAVRHLPCYAVGAETAATARAAGLGKVLVGEGDATALADCIAKDVNLSGNHLLYICGRLRRPVFEEILGASGFRVTPLETYETLVVEHDEREITAVFDATKPFAALVYSTEAALGLLRTLKSDAASPTIPNICFVCISSRVAAVLTAEGFATKIAAEPTKASLLTLLRDISSAQT